MTMDEESARRFALQSLSEDANLGLGRARELVEGWYFPFHPLEEGVDLGPQGLIVNKRSGEVFHLGSAFSVSRDLKLYDAGFQAKAYDLVIFKVRRLRKALRFLEELRITIVEPEFAHGRVWRIPRELKRDELKVRLADLPCVFPQQGLYFKFELVLEMRESRCCDFLILPR